MSIENLVQSYDLEDEELVLAESIPGSLLSFELINQTMVTGLLLEELDDSFLVALPVVLTKVSTSEPTEEKPAEVSFKAKPFSRQRSIRLFKTMVAITENICPEESAAYISYLKQVAETKFPGLIESFVVDSVAETPSTSSTSEKDLENKLEESLSQGLILNGTKTIH